MTQEEFIKRYTFNIRTDKVGGGSFGSVYKAYDTVLDREVAIKVSEVKYIDGKEFSLREEYNAIKSLPDHPYIANYETVYTFENVAGIFDYAIMQYYPLGNLSEYLKKNKLTDADKDKLLERILNGIAHLHEHKVLHRDIKPGNILVVDRAGEIIPKITDFGLSKQTEQKGQNTRFSNSFAGGTLQYSSPEQLKGEPLRLNTDLWSYGVIAYEVLTGKTLFEAKSYSTASAEWQNEVTQQILNSDLEVPLAFLPVAWKIKIKSCLTRDLTKRVQSAAAFKNLNEVSKNAIISPEEAPIKEIKKPTLVKEKTKTTPKEEKKLEPLKEKTTTQVKKKKPYFLIPILGILIIGLIVTVSSKYWSNNNDDKSTSLGATITFKNVDKVSNSFNYSKNIDTINRTSIFHNVKEFTPFSINKDIMYLYDPLDGKELFVREEKGKLYINNKLKSISTKKEDDGIEYLSAKDIKTLDFVIIDSMTNSIYKELERIVKINPEITLEIYNKDDTNRFNLKKLYGLTKPKFVSLPQNEATKTNYDNVKTVFLNEKASANTIQKIKLPLLKQLILIGGSEFPSHWQAESISVFTGDTTNLSKLKLALVNQANLYDLVILEGKKESIKSFRFLEDLKALKSFKYGGNNETIIPYLKGLKSSFVSIASIKNLELLVKNNPDLEQLELGIIKESKIDLKSLKKLKNLKFLHIENPPKEDFSLEPLKKLSKLKYISFSKLNDNIKRKAKEVCPDCIVYENHGFCLGSGWVLLVAPLFFIFLYTKRILENQKRKAS